MEIGFDSVKFIEKEKQAILERIAKFDGKLYMELGGKIFDDLHASRVLPGYKPNNKIKVLEELKDQLEIIICISAKDIEKNKIRADFGITYDQEVLRLIDNLKSIGLTINSVCITLFNNQPSATKFGTMLTRRGEKVYYHHIIENYPNDINKIVSDEGYGKNEYIETTRPLIVVSAPGPGSGKLSTCLSQMYHDSKNGVLSGYAKLESFPVWNLPLDHPVNIAYESATADLKDVNMIDPYHEQAYNRKAVNYNRDIEAFPVLRDILNKITHKEIYKSPTDMGINMIGDCIVNDQACRNAGAQEIIRRYLKNKVEYKKGLTTKTSVERNYELMRKLGLTIDDREVCKYAHHIQMEKDEHIVAIKLPDGRLVYGKNQGTITATVGAFLNALKVLANIPHENIIDRESVKNISKLKGTLDLGTSLDLKDAFIALSILANHDNSTKAALDQVENLRGSEVHATYIISRADEDYLRKLKCNLTCDDVFLTNKLF